MQQNIYIQKQLLVLIILVCFVIPSCKKIDSKHPKYLGEWRGGDWCYTTIKFWNTGYANYSTGGSSEECQSSFSGKADYNKYRIKIGLFNFRIISDIKPIDTALYHGKIDMTMTLEKSWLLNGEKVVLYHTRN